MINFSYDFGILKLRYGEVEFSSLQTRKKLPKRVVKKIG